MSAIDQRDAVVVRGEGVVRPPTAESVARLKVKADETGEPKDAAAYRRAADTLTTAPQESEQ